MNIDETLIKTTEAEYGAQYHQHAIDIYKLYVELTDALSARRQTVNSFFLTMNSFIIGLLGYGHMAIHKITSTPEFY